MGIGSLVCANVAKSAASCSKARKIPMRGRAEI
jgi:hypothetical protein